jgi:hypothetical protein
MLRMILKATPASQRSGRGYQRADEEPHDRVMRIDRTREHSASFAPLPAIAERHALVPARDDGLVHFLD